MGEPVVEPTLWDEFVNTFQHFFGAADTTPVTQNEVRIAGGLGYLLGVNIGHKMEAKGAGASVGGFYFY